MISLSILGFGDDSPDDGDDGYIEIPGDVIDPTPDDPTPDDPTPDDPKPDDPTPDDPKPNEPQKALALELTQKEGFENTPFKIENALPGDKEEKYHCITVTHDETVTVSFGVAMDRTKKLAAIARIKVEQLVPSAPDVVLYDGLMKDCLSVPVTITASGKTESPIYYRITVYTNGAEVTNEYIGEGLTAKFVWQLQ